MACSVRQVKIRRKQRGKACLFKVHDRGQGRVALEALDGSGFVTVVGAGLAADVRTLKQESEGSLFQWQDIALRTMYASFLEDSTFCWT